MRRTLGTLAACALALASLSSATVWAGEPPGAGRSGSATFSLDGVGLELSTPLLSDLELWTSAPGSAIQAATAVERAPVFRELSIIAAPFGAAPPTEGLPPAGPGQDEVYRRALRRYREEQKGHPRDGATMRLFGADVVGSTSVVSLPVRSGELVPVALTEWVAEAGQRLWIVRASRELRGFAPSGPTLERWFSGAVLEADDLGAPSSSLAATRSGRSAAPGAPNGPAGTSDLPFPAWWDGDCDTVSFFAATGSPAYPLGAEYRGMKACGPRPFADGGPERWVNFGAGYSQIEWQCPELSKRFLYLAYGIPPYGANGNQMVTNYEGELLEKVWNCTPGRAPQAGDVLSYGASSLYGHTSVVSGSDVDSDGNGTIDVIEQNSSSDGDSTLAVVDWCVTPGYTDIIGWLHHPGWSVAYYGDDRLADPCAVADRSGAYVFESWPEEPAAGCPSDGFSAVFSRTLDFVGGDYTFALGYDDAALLKIDGDVAVDGWGGSDQHYGTRHLEPGSHEMVVEYADYWGGGALTAFWWGPGFELTRETEDGSGWFAEHWGNPSLWWDPVARVRGGDGFLDYAWTDGGPAAGLPVDHFSSRFRRSVPLAAGQWRFDAFADDGVRFWVDGQIVLDEWRPQVAQFAPVVTLAEGAHDLRVEHYENDGWAHVRLEWEQVSGSAAPTGWISSPADGAIIEACPIVIAAEVGSGVGVVDRVEFHASHDGHWHYLGHDETSPYLWIWDCGPVRNQHVDLMVHVWSAAGDEFVYLDGGVGVVLNHLRCSYVPLILRLRETES